HVRGVGRLPYGGDPARAHLGRSVRRVYADHVHAGVDQPGDLLGFPGSGAERGDDLGAANQGRSPSLFVKAASNAGSTVPAAPPLRSARSAAARPRRPRPAWPLGPVGKDVAPRDTRTARASRAAPPPGCCPPAGAARPRSASRRQARRRSAPAPPGHDSPRAGRPLAPGDAATRTIRTPARDCDGTPLRSRALRGRSAPTGR